MKKVKGSMLVEFVKTIRADKSGKYEPLLSEEDRHIFDRPILQSVWYPFETYKNCFNAVAKVVAKNNLDTIRGWGRMYGQSIITNLYPGVIDEKNPIKSLKNYEIYFKSFYNFGDLKVEKVSENEAMIVVTDFEKDWEFAYELMAGWMEQSVKLSGGRDIRVEFISRSWEGDPDTRFRVSWTLPPATA